MNKHGLKQKHKAMVGKLKVYYDKKVLLENALSNVNNIISSLEKAKNNCSKQIKQHTKK